MMTGFPQIPKKEKEALLRFLFDEKVNYLGASPRGIKKELSFTISMQASGVLNPLVGIKHTVVEKVERDTLKKVSYEHTGYTKFLDSNGLPGISPPWGTLHAVDLNTGEYVWSVPFGETLELLEKGITGTGTENYGGAVVTQNGLLFIGATKDGFFRVFNKHNGELLWEYKLPAPAFATPAMYEIRGKQYIVIACGGEKLGTTKGNRIVAFALDQ